jgi:hypothetical protein
MGTIYQKAKEVWIWLGILDKPMLDFLDRVQSFGKRIKREMSPEKFFNNNARQEIVDEEFSEMTREVRDRLRSMPSKFWTLPYWSRVWVAQVLLSPDPESRNIAVLVDGIPVNFDFLFRWLSHIDHEPAPNARPGEKYGFRRSLSSAISPPHDKTPGSLPEYICEFRKCGCSDVRDRIFSLISIAVEPSLIKVDYEVSSLNLFCSVLENYSDGKSMDDLLVLGAHLLEALEIRASNLSQIKYTVSDLKTNAPCIPLKTEKAGYDLRRYVAVPSGTNGLIEFFEDSSDRRRALLLMLCIYVVVYDAENIHILEYAVTENESAVSVRYARTHEFIRGRPRNVSQDGMFIKIQGEDSQCHPAQWLPTPSEDVYYFPMFDPHPWITPRLRSWTGPKYHAAPLPAHDQLEAELEEYQYLELARRVWMESISFLRMGRVILPFTSPAAEEPLENLLLTGGIYDAQDGVRGCIVRRDTTDPEILKRMREQSCKRLDGLSEDE